MHTHSSIPWGRSARSLIKNLTNTRAHMYVCLSVCVRMCVWVLTYIHFKTQALVCLHPPPAQLVTHVYPVMHTTFPHRCGPSIVWPSRGLNHGHLSQGKPADVGSSRSLNFSSASKSLWVFCLLDYHSLYLMYTISLYLGHWCLSSMSWRLLEGDHTHSGFPSIPGTHSHPASSDSPQWGFSLPGPRPDGPQGALCFAPTLLSCTSPLLPASVFFFPPHPRLGPTCTSVINFSGLPVGLSFLSKLGAHYKISIP